MKEVAEITFPPPDAWTDTRRVLWMYVFVCNEFVKVGIAANPVTRLAAVAGSMPYDVALWGAWRVPYELARMAESHCHAILIDRHHRGEWFLAAPDETLDLVGAICAKAAKTYRRRTAALQLGKFKGAPVAPKTPRSRQVRAALMEKHVHPPESRPTEGGSLQELSP